MSDKIANLDDYRKDQLFAALAICLELLPNHGYCMYRWVAGVPKGTSLFKLECPRCGCQNSFASILPSEYLEHFGNEQG